MVAGILLVAYAAVGTSLLPAAATLLAALDGSHEMSVCLSTNGAQLTLHHSQADFTPAAADHRNPLGRMVTCLCRTGNAGDHRFTAEHLTASTTLEREFESTREVLPGPALNTAASFLLDLLSFRALPVPDRLPSQARLHAGLRDPASFCRPLMAAMPLLL